MRTYEMCIRPLLGQVINPKHVQNKTLVLPLTSSSASHKRTEQMETFPFSRGTGYTDPRPRAAASGEKHCVSRGSCGFLRQSDENQGRREEAPECGKTALLHEPPVTRSGTKTRGQKRTEALSTNGEEREKP